MKREEDAAKEPLVAGWGGLGPTAHLPGQRGYVQRMRPSHDSTTDKHLVSSSPHTDKRGEFQRLPRLANQIGLPLSYRVGK